MVPRSGGLSIEQIAGLRLLPGEVVRVVEQQPGTEGERAFTDEDVQRGAAALVTARGVRGLFVDDWQRELAALAVLEAAYPRPPESPEHQPDDEATVEALREELAESAKREVGAKHRVNDLERALETERSRTLAAVVEELREYGATVPAITVEVDDPLAVRTGSTTMPRSAADFIEPPALQGRRAMRWFRRKRTRRVRPGPTINVHIGSVEGGTPHPAVAEVFRQIAREKAERFKDGTGGQGE